MKFEILLLHKMYITLFTCTGKFEMYCRVYITANLMDSKPSDVATLENTITWARKIPYRTDTFIQINWSEDYLCIHKRRVRRIGGLFSLSLSLTHCFVLYWKYAVIFPNLVGTFALDPSPNFKPTKLLCTHLIWKFWK